MRIRVLGTMEVVATGGDAIDLRSPKLRRLLAALVINSGSVVSAGRLADIVWGDEQPANAVGALHTLVSRLRGRLADDDDANAVRIETRAPGYLLDLADGALDARRFERAVRDARGLLDTRPDEAASLLDKALTLWRGDAYAEFRDDVFARGEAARLDDLHATAREDRVDIALRRGEPDDAVARLELLTREHPLRERPQAQLMVALYRGGRQADALASYRAYHDRLADELGLAPSDDLQALERRILRNDPELRPTEGASADDETSDGVDGTDRTDRDDGPPARRPDTPPSAPVRAAATRGNLPAPPELIGRRALAGEVLRALDEARVVSLVGAGGVGKTSLALCIAAERRARHRDGTWWCELASVETDAAVADLVMTVLDAQPRAGMGRVDSLVDVLRGHETMLVFDNAEHVADGVAALLSAVVRACPSVSVLVTSRERLGIAGERVVGVPPLEVPPPGAPTDVASLRAVPAVALFARRAAAVTGDFAVTAANQDTVSEICRRLDGVPLALELAATRMRSMSPSDLVERLTWRFRVLRGGRRDGVERHRTLRALVDWSYELLDERARQVFDRLSVFAGDFTLHAAEHVVAGVADDIDTVDVTDVVADLVDASMVVATVSDGESRYVLLDTLRAYGRDRLEARGEMTAARRAHAHYYTTLAVRVSEALYDLNQPLGGAVLDRAIDELRAAHAWSVHHELELALRMVAALPAYVEQRVLGEAFLWAERAIDEVERRSATSPELTRSPHLPGAYGAAALSARFRGDLDRAVALAERGLAAVGDHNDPAAYVAMYTLAESALYQGRLDDARRIAEQMIALPVSSEYRLFSVWGHVNPILARAYGGEHDEAEALARRELRAARRANDQTSVAWYTFALAEVLVEVDPDAALEVAEDALALARAIDERFLITVAMVTTASLRARHGDPMAAVPLFREIVDRWHRAGNWTQQWVAARSIVGLLVRLHAHEDAAVLLGAMDGSATASAPYGTDAERLAEAGRTLAQRLGTDAFAAARERGAAMDDDDVVGWLRDVLDRVAAADDRRSS